MLIKTKFRNAGKVALATLFALVLLTAPVVAGEATITDRFSFDCTFAEIVEAVQGHEDEVLLGSFGTTEVVERKGDKIRVRVNAPGHEESEFTLRMKEDIDFRKKRAEFISVLVETEGFVTEQETSVISEEKDGKVQVTVRVHVKVPEVGDKLIRFEVRRCIQKIVRRINGLLD